MRSQYLYTYLLLSIGLLSCKERFEPNLPLIPQGYLVVEGFINADGPTRIKLSRTTPLDQKKTFKPELNAVLRVEGDDNTSFGLSAQPNGLYTSPTLTINPSRKYRLHIKTKDNKEYLSEFGSVKITPPIDSVSWKQDGRGVQVYVDTHDPQNKTIYYKYDYDETWEIQSAYYASYRYVNGIIRESLPTDPNVFNCWRYDTSNTIILGSSAKLEKDIIHLNPVLHIPIGDEKFGVRYSIQLKQYALDKEGYQFLEQMKKNTETLGTIFDPQPSSLKGNIRAIADPNEIVVGYINTTTVQQKRIFISNAQLSGKTFSIYQLCSTQDVPNIPDSIRVYVPPSWPYAAIFAPGLIAYKVSSSYCVDCRQRGGINIKPSFW